MEHVTVYSGTYSPFEHRGKKSIHSLNLDLSNDCDPHVLPLKPSGEEATHNAEREREQGVAHCVCVCVCVYQLERVREREQSGSALSAP